MSVEKPLEEEVAELERELPKAEIRGASHIDFGRRINRLIADWRARGEVRCVRCKKVLDSICDECSEEALENAFHQASLEKERTAKKYRLVPIEDETPEEPT